MKKRTIRKIKETACGLAFILVLLGGMAIGGFCDSTYTVDATVKADANGKYFVDWQGEAWDDDRANEYREDEKVRITFANNGTEHNRLDDIIITVKNK